MVKSVLCMHFYTLLYASLFWGTNDDPVYEELLFIPLIYFSVINEKLKFAFKIR